MVVVSSHTRSMAKLSRVHATVHEAMSPLRLSPVMVSVASGKPVAKFSVLLGPEAAAAAVIAAVIAVGAAEGAACGPSTILFAYHNAHKIWVGGGGEWIVGEEGVFPFVLLYVSTCVSTYR